MPVKNAYDEVIAVAQVINKNPDIDNGQFTEKDEQVMQNLHVNKRKWKVTENITQCADSCFVR